MSLSPQQRALRKRRSALKRSARLAARKRRKLDRNPQFSADSAAIQPLTLSALERRLPASEPPPETTPTAGLVPAPQAGSPPSREAFYRSLPPHVRQRMVEMALAKIEEIQRRSQLSTDHEDAEDGDHDELEGPGDVSVAEEFMDAEFDDEESQHQECDAQSFAESSGRPQTASPPVTAGAPASPTVLESGGATASELPLLLESSPDSASPLSCVPAGCLRPFHTLSSLAPTADPHWIWPGRLRRGEVTLLAGEGFSGKSFLACDLAARLSAGLPLPDAPDEAPPPTPVEVLLIVSLEVNPETLRDRLRQLHADVNRVQVMHFANQQNPGGTPHSRNVDLDRDFTGVATYLRQHPQVQLVIVDSFDRLTGSRTSATAIRRTLTRLQTLARVTGVPLLITKSYSRTPGAGQHLRCLGSPALADSLTAIWGISQPALEGDPDPSAPTHRLVPLKLNDTEVATSLDFTVKDGRVEWLGPPQTCPPRFHGYDRRQLRGQEERSAVEEAELFLRKLLAFGPLRSCLIREQANRAGVAWRTLQRAKTRLEVVTSCEQPGRAGLWNWWLPGTPEVRAPEHAVDSLQAKPVGRHTADELPERDSEGKHSPGSDAPGSYDPGNRHLNERELGRRESNERESNRHKSREREPVNPRDRKTLAGGGNGNGSGEGRRPKYEFVVPTRLQIPDIRTMGGPTMTAEQVREYVAEKGRREYAELADHAEAIGEAYGVLADEMRAMIATGQARTEQQRQQANRAGQPDASEPPAPSDQSGAESANAFEISTDSQEVEHSSNGHTGNERSTLSDTAEDDSLVGASLIANSQDGDSPMKVSSGDVSSGKASPIAHSPRGGSPATDESTGEDSRHPTETNSRFQEADAEPAFTADDDRTEPTESRGRRVKRNARRRHSHHEPALTAAR